MSQAFVREEESQWLHDVAGTLPALIIHLTRENNGIRVYAKKSSFENNRDVHEMSNGLTYAKDKDNRWEIV